MNVGIVGAGFFGEKHAQALSRSDDFRVVAACRSDLAASQEFVASYGGKAYTSYQEVLADPEVEAVLIATPHATHEEIAVAAARAGKHTLLEKPMSHTLPACQAIAHAFEGGPALLLGHVTRFSHAFLVAKRLITAGEIGEPIAGHASMRKLWWEPNRRAWHLDRSLGGGVLLTGGIHALDRLMWLLDRPVVSVAAQFATRFHDQNADDFGMILLRFADQGAGTIHSIGYSDGAPDHETIVIGAGGMLRIHSVWGVHIGKAEGWTHVPESGDSDWLSSALLRQWRELRAAAREGRPTSVNGYEGLRVMRVLFAAERSSQQGKEVEVV